MKNVLIILLVVISAYLGAQQLPQYSQYMLNEMAINPAVAGRDNYTEVRTNNRHQWVGITDAPRTYMMTVQGPMKNQKMGLGMNLYTDIVGPTRRTGVSASYAYHLKLTEKYKMSFGLSAGVMQWGIDGNKITLRDQSDQQLLTSYRTAPVPDFGAGVYFYEKNRFYVGIALPQIYQAPIELYAGAYKNSRLVSQLNFSGGYTFDVTEDFALEPSFLFKYVKPAPAKLDVGLRGIFQKQIWLGAVYRHMDAVSFLLGYMYKDYLTIGYSYDVTTTRIQKLSGGTHEIMLGLRFSRRQAATWESKKD